MHVKRASEAYSAQMRGIRETWFPVFLPHFERAKNFIGDEYAILYPVISIVCSKNETNIHISYRNRRKTGFGVDEKLDCWFMLM